MKHVRVGRIGQRTMTFLGRDAATYLFYPPGEPNPLKIVVVFAEISQIIGPNATGPDGSIGIDLGTAPARVTIDDLIFFLQNAFDQFVILNAESLGKSRHSAETFSFHMRNKAINRFRIFLGAWCDRQTDGVELNSLFSDLADELIGAGLVGVSGDVIEM